MSPDERPAGEMSFLQHLDELRGALLRSVLACLAGAVGGWWLAPIVLQDIIRRTVGHVVVLTPVEAFSERVKLALVLGLGIALPIVFVQIWGFVMPGLFRRERRLVFPVAMFSMVLFLCGVVGSYFYVTPLVARVMAGFLLPGMEQQIRVGELLSFLYNLSLACGLVFQLPLVTMLLTALGLVGPGTLLRQWRYAIVIIFFVTAVITPGDVVIAQVVMSIPMMALYFLSVGLSWMVARHRAEASPGQPAREGAGARNLEEQDGA
jgi:sec-independent protein translocase protein TatC